MDTSLAAGGRNEDRGAGRDRRREFYRGYDALLANWYLLNGRIQEDILVLRDKLHEELGRWRPHLPQPDWHAYADRLNMIAVRSSRP